jgi:acylglycerol lipase
MTQPREERIETTGGLKLFVRSWLPETDPRGVVVIVLGIKAHGTMVFASLVRMIRSFSRGLINTQISSRRRVYG